MPKTTHKYPDGYRFYNYEVVGIANHQYNGRTYSKYIIKCLKCGEITERNVTEVGKDIKCRGCVRNMEYYRYNVGDVVNGKTQRAYLCRCVVDGYTSVHSEDNLLKGKGCPVCGGTIIVKGINDINTVAPWLGDLLENKDDGYELGVGCHTKRRFRCPHCGTLTKPIAIYNVFYNKHISCRKCGDGISMPEKIMYGLLEQLGVDFSYQKTFKWSDGKIYDFYIPTYNMIIETHGLQHYRQNLNGNWGTSEEIQQNDRFKKNNAINNGICSYVEIDCSKSDPLHLIDTYKYNMSMYFDLSNIDFNQIILDSSKSFCIKAGDLWNSGSHDISFISSKLHLTKRTIKRYLKTLDVIGYLNINYQN